MVSDRVLLWPTVVLAKVSGEVVAVSAPTEAAVPDKETVSDGLEASLVTVNVPVGEPADAGANTTLNDLLAPAARVNGVVTPFTLNPVPVAETCETVTVDPPELVMVSAECSALANGCAGKSQWRSGCCQRSHRGRRSRQGTVSDGLEASLVTVNVPVGVPAVVGANTTLNDLLAAAPG